MRVSVQWMTILNITPDSFSEEAPLLREDTSVKLAQVLAQAQRQLEAGATVLDVGAESTRPEAIPVTWQEELARLMPVLEMLHAHFPETLLSVDTRKPSVAQAVLETGWVHWINDVSGGQYHQQTSHAPQSSPAMATILATHYHRLMAEAKAKFRYVLTHSQGTPQTMQHAPTYREGQCCEEVATFLATQALELHTVYHLPLQTLWFDVGFGFGKTFEHNLALLEGLEGMAHLIQARFEAAGVLTPDVRRMFQTRFPWLVGVSRKSMLVGGYPSVMPSCTSQPSTPSLREIPPPPHHPTRELLTAVAHTIAWQQGVRCFRVHDVSAHYPTGVFMQSLTTPRFSP
ncbi:MAG: dihydropteroate synthase [Vampirovibrionales bacterium]